MNKTVDNYDACRVTEYTSTLYIFTICHKLCFILIYHGTVLYICKRIKFFSEHTDLSIHSDMFRLCTMSDYYSCYLQHAMIPLLKDILYIKDAALVRTQILGSKY